MPIRINTDLPAKKILEHENIFVMDYERSLKQDIRPLKIIIMNLMPTKQETELQLLRSLSNTPLQVDITCLKTETHNAQNESRTHMETFYTIFPEITSTFHICWAAQAGLYYHYGVRKELLDEKIFGIFEHRTIHRKTPLVRGFDDVFNAPHSRHSRIVREDVEKNPELTILADSEEAGPFIIIAKEGRQIFVTGHPEYDVMTLDGEYKRDLAKGMDNVPFPKRYYKDDKPELGPVKSWRCHANTLYTNWLNYYVYQMTTYDPLEIQNLK